MKNINKIKKLVYTVLLGVLSVPLSAQLTDTGDKIGIGTSNPSSKIEINTSGSSAIKVTRNGANTFGFELGGTTFGLYDYTDNQYKWRTSNGNLALVENMGNLGIGTANPSSKFHINSPSSAAIRVTRNGAHTFGYEIGGSTFGLYDYTTNQYKWRTGNGNVLLVESSGNLGIGTHNPVSKMHVNSPNSAAIRITRNGAHTFGYEIGGSTFGLYDYTTNQYKWRTGNGNVLLVESSGNVGIGTTTTGSHRLAVNGTINCTGLYVNGQPFGGGLDGMTVERIPHGDYIKMNATYGVRDQYFLQVHGDFGSTDIQGTKDNSGKISLSRRNNTSLIELGRSGHNPNINQMTIAYGELCVSTDQSDCIPDYVFEEDYDLMKIEELAEYVKENKHLPNVPSEKELKEDGKIGMKDFSYKLLEKIEELTLYTIDQEKKIKDQETKMKRLEQLVNKQSELIDKLLSNK